MDGTRFFNILKKQKYTLVSIPILVMAIAFVLVRNLPDMYTSRSTIAAGLVDASQQVMLDKNFLQDNKVNQAFGNLMQIMQMKKMYDQVSYQLILHDLTNKKTFRKPSKLMGYLNQDARKHAIATFTELYANREPLSLWNPDQKGLNDVVASMGYDYESLSKKMRIFRVENSDFINVEYDAEDPYLAAFVVNTMCREFMGYHAYITKENERKSISYLGNLLEEKKDSMNNRMDALKNFKIENRILNLSEQIKSIYGQRADFETRIQSVQKEIDANEGALKNINAKLSPNDKSDAEKQLFAMNRAILETTQQINYYEDAFNKSGLSDRVAERKIDSLKEILKQELTQTTQSTMTNPIGTKETLINQKITLEVNRDLAKSSLKSLQTELDKLNKRFDILVPNEAVIQNYEGGINVASQEYVDILKKYNQTKMAYNSSTQLKQIEPAMPGAKQPSKKLLLVVVSGAGSFVICLLVLFILFYMDNSIKYVDELANKTVLPVLGSLPFIAHSSLLDLKQLWEQDNENPEDQYLKNQLRSIRFETENAIGDGKLLTITSFGPGEGKTFVAMCLASAFVMSNKKVLLIDGNFNNPSITAITQPESYLEDYINGNAYPPQPKSEYDLTILGNRGRDISLFELNNEAIIRRKIEELKDVFDIILIELSPLSTLNQSKEWINVADHVLGVYEANKTMTGTNKLQSAYLRSLGEKYAGWVLNKETGEQATKKKRRFFRKNK